MIEIIHAQYLKHYKIKLTFNNGQEGIADLKSTIFEDTRKIFSELKTLKYFKNFQIKHNTITWPNELDLASEYLFYLSFKNDLSLKQKFYDWGYLN